jgi:hypothetical protein
LFDPAHNAGFQPHFDAVGVRGGFGEDILNPALSQVSGPLVLLLDHRDQAASGNIFSVCSIHWNNLGRYPLKVMFLLVATALLRLFPPDKDEPGLVCLVAILGAEHAGGPEKPPLYCIAGEGEVFFCLACPLMNDPKPPLIEACK